MAVIQTQDWLYNFLEACKKPSKITPFQLQRELICKPMGKYFSTNDLETLHFELLNNGLFEPSEWTGIEKGVGFLYSEANAHASGLHIKEGHTLIGHLISGSLR